MYKNTEKCIKINCLKTTIYTHKSWETLQDTNLTKLNKISDTIKQLIINILTDQIRLS